MIAPDRTRTRKHVGLFTACVALSLLGCGQYPSGAGEPYEPAPAPQEHTGSLSLSLQVGGAHLSTVQYAVIGSTGFQRTGSLNVANSSTVSGLIGGIPFGTGYSLSLNATSDSSPIIDCVGAANFDVTSETPVAVPVHLECHERVVTPPPPPPPAQAPIPPLATLLLATLLCALGVGVSARRRSGESAG